MPGPVCVILEVFSSALSDNILEQQVQLAFGQKPAEKLYSILGRDAEILLGELINHYCTNGEHTREAIRKLFKEYQAFAWAVSLSFDPKTEESFRQHLLLFSMKDQGMDSRDALLLLQHLCGRAVAAGVNTGPILKEIADLSSDKNKYGMGSTKDMLLKASRK